MRHVDMRKLAPAAQEERRRQVIGLRERGLTYGPIADQCERAIRRDTYRRGSSAGYHGIR
jgi:hypothetical protein